MRRLLVCLIAAVLSAGAAHAQMLENLLAPAPIVVLGQTAVATTAPNNNGIYFWTAVATGATTYHALNCTIPFAGVGTAGDHLECGIYGNASAKPSTPICFGQYTETGSETAAITIPLAGCGTLAASTGYWIFVDTDDAAFNFETYSCGSTCSGTFPSTTTPTDYFFAAYGSRPSNPAVSAATGQAVFTISVQ